MRQRAGNPRTVIAPVSYDARSPRFLFELLRNPGWRCGTSPVRSRPVRLRGRDGGLAMAEKIESPDRSVPLIAVSECEGFRLVDDIDIDLAKDLCGIATVVALDISASFALTDQVAREWSCFNAPSGSTGPAPKAEQTP